MNDRSELTFRMTVREVFRFADGRTVFVGTVDEGEEAILLPGKCELSMDGQTVEIELQPEMIGQVERLDHHIRAVATSDTLSLPNYVSPGQITLKGRMRMRGHRDLVGIESPPHEFVPDRMALGPRLPEGWDGDAWTSPDESSYFLRAWNKATATYAIGTGNSYEDARAILLDEIAKGGRRVEIRVEHREPESGTGPVLASGSSK
jgi:hypothetical protein